MKIRQAVSFALIVSGASLVAAADAGAGFRTPPRSQALELQPLAEVKAFAAAAIDREALLAEDGAAAKPAPLRIASVERISLAPDQAGTWEALEDGARLWRLRVQAPNATDLNLGFSRFRLPPGASLHILSEAEAGFFQGPYTSADNAAHGELWTAVVPGDRAVVELYVPASAEFEPELRLGAVGRGYRDLFKRAKFRGDQGSCNIDVICPEGDQWRDEIRSVARYTFVDSDTFICTGTLVRDVPGSGIPYVLSAGHCGVSESTDQTVVVYWNFESAVCGSLDGFPGAWSQNQSGAVFRATRGGPPNYGDNDMLLLQLEETPDESFNVYYAGWDARTGSTPQSSVCIHHPQGEAKAISFNDDALSITSSCIGSSSSNTHWRVDNWEQGTTEQGSSGAGLWDPATRRIVGYLSGGTASCDDPQGYDCFGRLAIGWDGASASGRLKDWLDPGNTGTLFVNGIDPGAGSGEGTNVSNCGNAFYDDGVPEGTAWYGGGNAGNPNFMFAVYFKLADFGFTPGNTRITKFCASNQNAWTGGPWPNQVFVYPDESGFPDDSTILAQGTVFTGDGQGWYEVTLDTPVTLDGDFWLVMRGDPRWQGEDFNMDFDETSLSGQSLGSDSGIAGLQLAPRNFMLRATLEEGGGGPGYGDGPYNYHVGAIVHSTGVGGAFFRTKMGVLNLSGSNATVTLTYFWNNGPTTVTRTVAGGRLQAWDDLALTVFGLGQNTSGSVLVNSTQPLIVTTRTYTSDATGTFGSFMPGVEVSDGVAPGQTGILSQLTGNSDFRTNIGVVNLSAATCQARVQLKSAGGANIGSPRTLSLAAYKFTQINDVFAATGAGTQNDAYATVEALTSGCRVWAYASVIDGTNASPGTNDPTLIPLTVVE